MHVTEGLERRQGLVPAGSKAAAYSNVFCQARYDLPYFVPEKPWSFIIPFSGLDRDWVQHHRFVCQALASGRKGNNVDESGSRDVVDSS